LFDSNIGFKVLDNEAKVISRLCSPGRNKYIVVVWGHKWLPRQSSFYCIDMEYCDETLASRIQRPVGGQANTEVFAKDDVSKALPEPSGKAEQDMRNTAVSFSSDGTASWGSNLASDLDWETVIKIIGDIVSGLIYIHAEEVVHRDLKPANGNYPFLSSSSFLML
jgi:serine/threonine protein kinase